MKMPVLALALLATQPVVASAQSPVPFVDHHAIRACQAMAAHRIEAEHGVAPRADGRFATARLAGHAWHVSGHYLADLAGGTRSIGIHCDVSSAGVALMTMLVEN